MALSAVAVGSVRHRRRHLFFMFAPPLSLSSGRACAAAARGREFSLIGTTQKTGVALDEDGQDNAITVVFSGSNIIALPVGWSRFN